MYFNLLKHMNALIFMLYTHLHAFCNMSIYTLNLIYLQSDAKTELMEDSSVKHCSF